MTTSQVDKRLRRLTDSNICSFEKASEYAEELKKVADNKISKDKALKKSKLFKALSDPTRLRMLGLLTVREMCVCEIMVALELTQPTASHHLKILENAELVRSRKEGRWVFYSLPDAHKILGLIE